MLFRSDLRKLMDHEFQMALRDRGFIHRSYSCSRGIEHILSGEIKTLKIARHSQQVLKLQAQLKQAGESTANTMKMLKALSRQSSLEDRQRAQQLGYQDAFSAKQLDDTLMKEDTSMNRSTLHQIGSTTYRIITGNFHGPR